MDKIKYGVNYYLFHEEGQSVVMRTLPRTKERDELAAQWCAKKVGRKVSVSVWGGHDYPSLHTIAFTNGVCPKCGWSLTEWQKTVDANSLRYKWEIQSCTNDNCDFSHDRDI
jgi:hypothetical protein